MEMGPAIRCVTASMMKFFINFFLSLHKLLMRYFKKICFILISVHSDFYLN